MAELIIFTGRQAVAPYEANLIARAEQIRAAIASASRTKLANLRSSLNRLDAFLTQDVEELYDAWGQVRRLDHRPYHPDLPASTFWMSVTVLLSFETALNKGALDQLKVSEQVAWLSAGLISASSFVAAKTTARLLRQRPSIKVEPGLWILAAFVNLSLFAGLYLLADYRAVEAKTSGAGWLFFALQMAAYAAALALNYRAIDPVDAREQLTRRVRDLEAKLERRWLQRGQLADDHNATRARDQERLRDIVHDTQERVYQYRDANLRTRTDDPPEFMSHPITDRLFVPVDLGRPVDPHPLSIADIIANAANQKG